MQLFAQLALLNFELHAKQIHRAICATTQHLRHGDKTRLIVIDYAAVWRIVHLTFSECIERIYRLVARSLSLEVNTYLYVFRCIIVDFLDIEFAFFVRLHNRIHQHARSHSVWHLYNLQRLIVDLLNLGTNRQFTATLAIVVFRHIHHAPGWKIGIEFELFATQISHRRIAQFAEVVRQNS